MLTGHRIILGALLALPMTAFSQTRSEFYGTEVEKQAMTAFVQADVGQVAYESQVAASKDVHETNTYAFGVQAGERRELGILVSSATATVPLVLNKSTLDYSQRNLKFTARFGWLVPSLDIGQRNLRISQDGNATTDLVASTAGAGVGVIFALWGRGLVEAKASMSKPLDSFDRTGAKNELTSCTEADASATVNVVRKLFDLSVGYRTKNMDIAREAGQAKESYQGAYAGMRLGVYF